MSLFRVGELAAGIVEQSIKSPQDFETDKYRWTHKPSGVKIWIANRDYGLGAGDLGEHKCFTWRERRKLFEAYTKWHRKTIGSTRQVLLQQFKASVIKEAA